MDKYSIVFILLVENSGRHSVYFSVECGGNKLPVPIAASLINDFILTPTAFLSYFFYSFVFASWDHHPKKLPSTNSLFQSLLLREWNKMLEVIIPKNNGNCDFWKCENLGCMVQEPMGPLRSPGTCSHFLRKRIPLIDIPHIKWLDTFEEVWNKIGTSVFTIHPLFYNFLSSEFIGTYRAKEACFLNIVKIHLHSWNQLYFVFLFKALPRISLLLSE